MAILILKKSERSLGNSMQSAGGFLGTLIGSGVLLLLYNYFGWKALSFGLAAFVLVALVPLLVFKIDKTAPVKYNEKALPIRYADMYRFFTQKGILKQVILLLLFYSGIIGILTMLKPFLVDLGYAGEEIGFMSGIVGTAVAACSAFFAGWLVKKIGLKRGAILFSALLVLVPCYFYWMSAELHYAIHWLYIGIVLLWGTYGMATIIVYTTSMNCVRMGYEGTDFTLQTVLTHLGSLLFAVASGKVADALTYKGLFAIEIVFAVGTFLYVWLIYSKKECTIGVA